jgi:hypothetical protein
MSLLLALTVQPAPIYTGGWKEREWSNVWTRKKEEKPVEVEIKAELAVHVPAMPQWMIPADKADFANMSPKPIFTGQIPQDDDDLIATAVLFAAKITYNRWRRGK